MKGASRTRLVRGVGELGGAALCLLALIATMCFLTPSFTGLSLLLFGFMILTADGLISILQSRRIGRFR
jgi:hypothetical protein